MFLGLGTERGLRGDDTKSGDTRRRSDERPSYVPSPASSVTLATSARVTLSVLGLGTDVGITK